jgi:hypothetical protein
MSDISQYAHFLAQQAEMENYGLDKSGYFKQDGVPAHYTCDLINYLDDLWGVTELAVVLHFRDHSHYLMSPFDFWLWGVAKHWHI